MTTPWQQYLDDHLPVATDDLGRTLAIQGALNLVPVQGVGPYGNRVLAIPPLRLPFIDRGEIELDVQLDELGAPVIVDGTGKPRCLHIAEDKPVRLDLNGCALLTPIDAFGIHVEAQCTVISDGTIASVSGARTGTGVLVESSRVRLENLFLRELAVGREYHGWDATNNADLMRDISVDAAQCDVGVRIRGLNANGGVFVADFYDNCGEGILDESALGNAHFGPMLHTIAKHAIRITGDSDHSSFFGTYLENDCGIDLPWDAATQGPRPFPHPGTIDLRGHATFAGGIAIGSVPSGFDRVGGGQSALRFRQTAPDGSSMQVKVPFIEHNMALEASYTSARKPQHPTPKQRAAFALGWHDQYGASYIDHFGLFRADGSGDFYFYPIVGATDARAADGDDARVHGRKVPKP